MSAWRILKWGVFALVPAAIILKLAGMPPVVVFIAAGLALLPLAGLMGAATEHLSARAGAGLGAFLNATLGNAAEFILAFVALRKGLVDMVKASLTGSILGNSLLVLGAAILAGGLRHRRQQFNATAAGVGSTLLVLSATSLILPATFHHLVGNEAFAKKIEESMSLPLSGVLLFAYALNLLFSFRTHKHLYAGAEGAHAHEGQQWSLKASIAILSGTTVLVAVLSEILVGEVEHVSHEWGLNEIFVGVVLIAFFGNAAEHSSAILMAWKDRMDIALGITVGSSIQIALFVAPVLVFASLGMDRRLDLVFSLSEVVAVTLSAWIVSLVCHDGESHWLEGVLLLALYSILGLTFYYLPGS